VTTLAAATGAPISINRRMVAAGTFILFGLVDIFVFGLFAHPGDATFTLSVANSAFHMPTIHAPAATVAYTLGAASIAIGLSAAFVDESRAVRRLNIALVLLFFVISLLCWAYAGSAIPLNVVNLLQSTMNLSIPLVLGALAGCMCERSGVINIAIEGQLLTGAFAAAVVASAFGALSLGLITGSLAGGLLGALLAVFAIRFLADQIILGVVLNVLAAGLTGYLNDRILVSHPDLNAGLTFNAVKIPVLGDIPIIGPIFFDSTIFLYIMYAMIILVQVGLFSTRWGLRVRAVGEHPTAADTVGIRVLATRYRNVIRPRLHRPGSDDLRPLDAAGRDGGGAALRVRQFAAGHAVYDQRPDSLLLPADGPVRRHHHCRRRPGRQGQGARGRRQTVCQGLTPSPTGLRRPARRG
jgi:ribose/xylose/arabinose/galactoside ABC-type transport system permease subunit